MHLLNHLEHPPRAELGEALTIARVGLEDPADLAEKIALLGHREASRRHVEEIFNIGEGPNPRLGGALGVEEEPGRETDVLIAIVDPDRSLWTALAAVEVVEAENDGAADLLAGRRGAAPVD